MEIIIRKTRREAEESRRESLARAGLSPNRYRGTAQSLDEAHETQRKLERDGEPFDKLWQVSGREAERAEEEVMRRSVGAVAAQKAKHEKARSSPVPSQRDRSARRR